MRNMQRFTNVPRIDMPRSQFDRSHTLHTTFDGDYLIPVLLQEIYPGDTLKLDMSFMARMATPLYPIMHDFYIDTFFFFVPNRIVWENWRKFMGEQEDPGDSIDYTIPVITLDTDCTTKHGLLGDYMGIPLIDYNTSNYTCNALPFRGYYKIWNEWFRDQNLQDSLSRQGESGASWSIGDGPDADTYSFTQSGTNGLQKRGKRHDYFTSALPWLQKGDAVELPLGSVAPIGTLAADDAAIAVMGDGNFTGIYTLDTDGSAGGQVTMDKLTAGVTGNRLLADLSNATAATVNEVRQAFQIQRLLERDARAGTRYPELIKSHFGSDFYDLTYRPEYLGGGSEPINITPIANTDITIGTDGAGLSGAGTALGTGHGFVKSFQEHGFVFGIVSARADLVYQEGLERMWSRSTRYDYMWPTLQNIGEQAIYNKELVLDDTMITAGDDALVFGYQERYSELKYQPNRLTGLMRSNASSTLDPWHLAEELGDGAGSFPLLDSDFIESNTPWARTQATPGEPDFIFNAQFNMKHTRTLSTYSIPGMIDHF